MPADNISFVIPPPPDKQSIEGVAGDNLTFAPIIFTSPDAKTIPEGIKDFTAFDGALVAIVFAVNGKHIVTGSAFLVAPGTAISAVHVFDEYTQELAEGQVAVLAVGFRKSGVVLWDVRKVATCEHGDISILSLWPRSEIPADRTFSQIPTTTRAPKTGERILLIGFTEGKSESVAENPIKTAIMVSSGTVSDFFPEGRDAALVPYPSFQVDCGTVGGMSGGAAIAEDGHVLGVISTGMNTEDQCGPTVLAWFPQCVSFPMEFAWPNGLIDDGTSLLEIDERLCFMQGREYVKKTGENEQHVTLW